MSRRGDTISSYGNLYASISQTKAHRLPFAHISAFSQFIYKQSTCSRGPGFTLPSENNRTNSIQECKNFEIELRVFVATTLVCAINNIFDEVLHANRTLQTPRMEELAKSSKMRVSQSAPKLNLDVDDVA